MKKLFSQLGFTLIELLVVISVIGVLAVAVLSSINPIEQINKGRDTRTRSDAAQTINAVDRYYATAEMYPWNSSFACGADASGTAVPCSPAQQAVDLLPTTEFPTGIVQSVCPTGTGVTGFGLCLVDDVGGAWMDALAITQEVKTGFVSRVRGLGSAGTYAIYVYKDAGGAGSNDTLYACFKPSSEAFKREALDVCGGIGKGAGVYASYPDAVQLGACPGAAIGAGGDPLTPYAPTTEELICLP